MLNIIITFDYEIFFGKNYASEDKVLFEPTEKLLDILDENDISGTFFADILSVQAYNKEKEDSDYSNKFENQIKEMIKRGHDVQLHIHPHWITAKFDQNSGQWKIDPSTYRIHYFLESNPVGVSAEDIIRESVEYLENTLKDVDKSYKCYAYRAGGYCIQPGEALFDILQRKGIIIDSSVCMGKKLISDAHFFDFEKDYDDLNWELYNTKIKELPIGSVNNNLIKRFLPNSGFQTLVKEPSNGEGIAGTTKPTHSRLYRLLKYNRTKKEFGLEFMNYKQIMYGLKKYYIKYNCAENDCYLALICHPKSMDNISMQNMEQLISEVKANGDWVRFCSMKDMLKSIERE